MTDRGHDSAGWLHVDQLRERLSRARAILRSSQFQNDPILREELLPVWDQMTNLRGAFGKAAEIRRSHRTALARAQQRRLKFA